MLALQSCSKVERSVLSKRHRGLSDFAASAALHLLKKEMLVVLYRSKGDGETRVFGVLWSGPNRIRAEDFIMAVVREEDSVFVID